MNYKEAVERKITGETNELSRRKKLWEGIVNAYEEGGEEAVRSVSTKRVDEITKKYKELLDQLRKKL